MGALGHYDWIFGTGLIFAFLDAYGIGANDVANSFATSVSSRSLTLFQACIAASIFEFLGAVLAGSRVADTIRSKIIQTSLFANDPAVLMLAMWCCLIATSTWLLVATRMGFAVSTTHSITGAVLGVGLAIAPDGSAVNWGWKGVAQVFAAWGIAPGIAGAFSAIIYLIIKYGILERENSTRLALYAGPVWFFVTSAILTMSVVWKGAPNLKLDKLSTGTTITAIFGTAAVVAILCILFWVPFVHARVIKGDYTLKWYHFFLGPLLWRRPTPEDASEFTAPRAVPDYYKGHHDDDYAVTPEARHAMFDPENPIQSAGAANDGTAGAPGTQTDYVNEKGSGKDTSSNQGEVRDVLKDHDKPHQSLRDLERPKWRNSPMIVLIYAKYYLFDIVKHNMTRDVVSMQKTTHLQKIHAQSKQYPNQTEHAFSFLQVMTACTMSFAHGSNDVSNAIGPLATIYVVWKSGSFTGATAAVPIWVLVFGAVGIVIGLATWGYKIMSALGNRITLHSPSRGFSMELGSATTVIIATRLALPVSTTQIITGSTTAVGIMSGGFRAVNWRQLGYIYLGWLLTLPITGLIGGLLFAIITNSPNFGYKSTVSTQYLRPPPY